MPQLPLEGVRVLDLSRLLPGPYCTLLLADMGADVIKVEDTQGGDYIRWMPPLAGEYSALYHALNRNKRAISVDLKTERGRDILLRLAERADVVVESFRPGVMERLGVGYDELRASNAGLILCSITGYGQNGPYRNRAGHDLDYIAVSGVLGMTGSVDGTPAIPGVQVADIGGGAQNAAVAILAALVGRARTGLGTHLDVSMLDSMVSWLSITAARYFADGESPGPAGHVLNGRNPCYRVYPTADGWLAVGALEPKFWHAFCRVVGLPEHADAGLAEGDEAAAVVTAVEQVLATRTTAEWQTAFDGEDACVESVLDLAGVFGHEQVLARELVIPAGEAGPLRQVAHPLVFDGTRPGVRSRAPGIGEHTAAVLAEVGIGPSGYADLLQEGVVR